MRRTVGAQTCLAFLVLALAAAAGANNPRISLRLTDVTAADAVSALAREAGVPVTLTIRERGGPGLNPSDPRLQWRADFDWQQLPVADALRELCGKYRLRVDRREGGYLLSDQGRAAGEPELGKSIEQGGVRLSLLSCVRDPSASLPVEQRPKGFPETLEVGLRCLVPGGDSHRIAGVANVSAEDDHGRLLLATKELVTERPEVDVYPDEWTGVVPLAPPPHDAKRLRWVEGDLVAYRVVRSRSLDVPVDANTEGSQRRIGDIEIELPSFHSVRLDAENPSSEETFVETRVTLPSDDSVVPADSRTPMMPVLITAGGRAVWPRGTAAENRREATGHSYSVIASYPTSGEKVVKAVFEVIERSDPSVLFAFRWENVPLPPPPSGPDPNPLPPAVRAFFSPGGGSVATQVLSDDREARDGSLLLGFQTPAGDGWGAIRWVPVEVNAHGLARIDNVPPGTYRLSRKYLPERPAQGDGPGRWENDGALVVEVRAGEETVAPPLRWVAER